MLASKCEASISATLLHGVDRRRSHRRPACAAVACKIDQAVVGAGPKRGGPERRRRERVDDAARFGPVGVVGGRRAIERRRNAEWRTASGRRRSVPNVPRRRANGRRLARCVERVVGAETQRHRPLRSPHSGAPVTSAKANGSGPYAGPRGRRIPPKTMFAIARIGHDVPLSPPAVIARQSRASMPTWSLRERIMRRAAVLLRAVEVVRETRGRSRRVELSGRLVEPRTPGLAAVDG